MKKIVKEKQMILMILNAFIETDIMSFYYTCFVKLCKRNTSRKNIIGFYPPVNLL